jgi:hypothetical protein
VLETFFAIQVLGMLMLRCCHQVLLQRMTKVMTTGTDLFDSCAEDKHTTRSLNSVARKQRMVHISKRNKVGVAPEGSREVTHE